MTIRKEWLVDLFEGITFSVVEKVSKAWKTSLTQTEKSNSDRASGFEKFGKFCYKIRELF